MSHEPGRHVVLSEYKAWYLAGITILTCHNNFFGTILGITFCIISFCSYMEGK